MYSEDYQSAFAKISPRAGWQEETLQKMRAAEEKPRLRVVKSKQLRILAAAAVFAIVCIPAAGLFMRNSAASADLNESVQKPEAAAVYDLAGAAPEEAAGTDGTAQSGPAEQNSENAKQAPPLLSAHRYAQDAAPARNLPVQEVPRTLAVYAAVQGEKIVPELEKAAAELGVQDFTLNADGTSALAGEYRLSYHGGFVRCERADGTPLALPQENTAPQQQALAYYEDFAAGLMKLENPAVLREDAQGAPVYCVYEAAGNTAAEKITAAGIRKIRLVLKKEDGALMAAEYPAVEEMQQVTLKSPRAAAQEAFGENAGEVITEYTLEYVYSEAENTIVPVYRFTQQQGETVTVHAAEIILGYADGTGENDIVPVRPAEEQQGT